MNDINKMLDELIDDFRYCLSDLLDLVTETTITSNKKLNQYRHLWEKYFV